MFRLSHKIAISSDVPSFRVVGRRCGLFCGIDAADTQPCSRGGAWVMAGPGRVQRGSCETSRMIQRLVRVLVIIVAHQAHHHR